MFCASIGLGSGNVLKIGNIDAKFKDALLNNMRYGRITEYTDTDGCEVVINSKMIEYMTITPVEEEDE